MGGFFDSEPIEYDKLKYEHYKPIISRPSMNKNYSSSFFIGGTIASYIIGKLIRKKFPKTG